MAICPNCRKEIPSDSPQCPACKANFTSENGWRPLEEGEQWTGSVDRKPQRKNPYVPNYVPYETRMSSIAALVFLIVHVAVSLYIGEMYIPNKRGTGLLLTGGALIFGVLAAISAMLNLVAKLIDHLDTRDNEIDYQLVDLVTKIAAWSFFVIALLGSCIPRKF